MPRSISATTCRRRILQVPGAKDIAVEFTSMSKTYSMPGWRMGFAAGNPRLITALTRMKSYLDYGAFTPIQVAAVAALNGPQDCVAEMRALYRERRDVLIRGLAQAGWDVPSPDGSMFAWAPIPPRYAHLGSVEFSKLLLAAGAGGGGAGHRASANTATGMCASRWWRTRTGCARRCATSAAFLQADNNLAEPSAAAQPSGDVMTRPLFGRACRPRHGRRRRAASCCATTPTSSPRGPGGRSR